MKREFFCSDCNSVFESQGKKKISGNRVYGPMWKYVSKCPKCKNEVDEHKRPSMTKKNRVPNGSAPACATGKCPFVN